MIDSYWVVPETEDDIEHFGVKGMKWGVRKKRDRSFRIQKKTTNKGKSSTYIMREGRKKVGVAYVDDFDNGSSNVDWISVKKKYRGKGYASKTIDTIIKDAEDRGRKSITLDALTGSPDAVHIYEKAGFKKVKQMIDADDPDAWYITMERVLSKKGQ